MKSCPCIMEKILKYIPCLVQQPYLNFITLFRMRTKCTRSCFKVIYRRLRQNKFTLKSLLVILVIDIDGGRPRRVCLVLSARFARLQSEKITPVRRANIWTNALFIGLNECVSKASCETYPGDKPFTEIETQTVAAYLKSRASELVSFFDIHSYSQLWMSPWGNKNGTPAEYNLMVSRKTNYLTKKKSHLKARTTWGYPLVFGIRNSAQEIRNPAS